MAKLRKWLFVGMDAQHLGQDAVDLASSLASR
jgi:hypothetical protein